MLKQKLFFLLILLQPLPSLVSYEKVQSRYDLYFKNLSVLGIMEKPNLNFNTASLNTWHITGNTQPWENQKQERTSLWTLKKGSLYLLESEIFQSYNKNTPYGMNDSGLWQGKGYNLALSGGILFTSDYLDVVVNPEIYFSQNQYYSIQQASSWSDSEYGFSSGGIDSPQRFGDVSFGDASFGQSQIRFKYNNMTLGIGNENIWIGPGQQSAIISSNNAAGYPHIDIGLIKTETNAGFFEAFAWWGVLKSSEYHKKNPELYEDFLSGISLSYSPIFMPGFTLGFNKTSQVKLDNFDFYSLYSSMHMGLIRAMGNFGRDVYDGRASISWKWQNQEIGFEFYGEWAREDYSSGLEGWIRTPEHASGFILGVKQVIPVNKDNKKFIAVNAEFASLVWSMDYFIDLGWGGGFYRHSRTNLGYTNEGQSIGAGFGTGGNMQYLGVDYCASFGKAGINVRRIKWDDSLLYSEGSNIGNPGDPGSLSIPYQLAIGPTVIWNMGNDISIGGEIAYILDKNWNMISGNDYNGFYAACSINYRY